MSHISPSAEEHPPRRDLTASEIRRYGRHLILPEVGVEGQQRLGAARVLLVGAGGLGSPAALYLAAAGVGHLGIVDFDQVDESNLQRQVLFGNRDLGRPKVEAGSERLRDLNSEIDIVGHDLRLDLDNARALIRDHDLVVDGSDNFATRYLINDACLLEGRPLVWGAVLRFEGQISVFGTPDGPCYRCLFPEPPPPGLVPSCAEGGVLGVLPGIIGSLQANEAIKLILGIGTSLAGRFVVFDALGMNFRELALSKNPDCPACSDIASLELRDAEAVCENPAVAPAPSTEDETVSDMTDEIPFHIDVQQLNAWREEGRDHVLLDVREPQEVAICQIDPAATHIPMRQLMESLDQLDKDALTVVHCHHGPRSSHAVDYMRSQGFQKATNLSGGIDAWSAFIDPSVPRY